MEDCRSVSISFLRRHDYFCGHRYGRIIWKNYYGEKTNSIGITVSTMNAENYVRFQYAITDRNTGKKTKYDYEVQLTTTPCNFGGVRYWFVCPLSNCGQRVAKLYKAPNTNYFGCRDCYNLSYESRNESRLGRIGQLGYLLKIAKQIEELHDQIKRWTYSGRPTRKVRRLLALKQKMEREAMGKIFLE